MTLTIDALAAGPASVDSTFRRPQALAPGATIGIAMPSYAPRRRRVRTGVRACERAGFRVRMDADVLAPRRFHRREDARRAERFMAIWSDPAVDAILAGAGGYGAVRLLPHLDPEAFRHHPKIFVGYSDATALHCWLARFAGLRTFHGPTLDDLGAAGATTVASLLSALTHPHPETRLGLGAARTVRPGRAVGRLTGGNLSLVQQTIGTPYEVAADNAILFLEETKDPMSVADERLVHLRRSGVLDRVAGIVFGHFTLDRSETDEFQDFLVDLVADLGVPVLMNFPAGHKQPNLTLPLGTAMELVAEPESGWLRYAEPALTPLRAA